jgi:alpha-tubulin suppressor-like RCC1 family protein
MLTNVSNIIAVAAGSSHTLALDAFGKVWTWGDNTEGELGRSGATATPGQVPNLSNVVAIACGSQFTLAVTSNGQVCAWGNNGDGQLGTNTDYGTLTSPAVVVGISNAVLVSASLAARPRRSQRLSQHGDDGGSGNELLLGLGRQ